MSLLTPLTVRDVTLRNRIAVSPMCQYSSEDGFANDWHSVHLGSRAVGGAGLVFTEAAAVEVRGLHQPARPGHLQGRTLRILAAHHPFLREQGAVAGIQLAHAGRKASTARPWEGGKPLSMEQGGWRPIVGASPIPFAEGYAVPEALDADGIAEVVRAFGRAAERALAAGFQVVEIHGAHGYLLHSFYSPLANQRADSYGGSFVNRTRLVREVAEEIRRRWPERYPVFLRISASDWTEGGWDIEQSVELARQVKPLGVDLIDASSGGNIATASIPVGFGYQTPFAARIRQEADILTGAVGMITSPQQAEHILRTGQADLVLLAREFLRDPYFPRRAAKELREEIAPPPQYGRAW